jgi:hypothetical protein
MHPDAAPADHLSGAPRPRAVYRLEAPEAPRADLGTEVMTSKEQLRAAFDEWCKGWCSPGANSSEWYWTVFQGGAEAQRRLSGETKAERIEEDTAGLPLTVEDWVAERLANTTRIAMTKTGADRASWIEDGRYWRLIYDRLRLKAECKPGAHERGAADICIRCGTMLMPAQKAEAPRETGADALSRVRAVLPDLDPYDARVVQAAIDGFPEKTGDQHG